MKIFILANGGVKLGMGHIMRTSVLGHKLQKKLEVIYVISDKDEFKSGVLKIKELGFKLIYEEGILENLTKNDILIIDRYDLNEKDLSFYKSRVKKLIVFDDNNLLDFYDVDIILNQNLHARELMYKTNDCTKLLCGSEFVLLRDEFLDNKAIKINKELKNILITIGGSDNLNLTHRILKEIKHFNANIRVVIGPAFKYNDELKEGYENYKNIKFYENVNMPEIMKKTDLAISACGGTIYELAYLGIPTIGLVIVDNQEKSGAYLNENNIVKISKVENLLKDLNDITFEDRKRYSEKMKSLVDGKGKYRAVEVILDLSEN